VFVFVFVITLQQVCVCEHAAKQKEEKAPYVGAFVLEVKFSYKGYKDGLQPETDGKFS